MKICSISGCVGGTRIRRGWCGKHYYRWKKYGDPNYVERYKTPEEAFEARTMPVTETGCLLWTGSTDSSGYGTLKVKGKTASTHKFAWEQKHGSVPEGLKLDHKCHTPACCNPDHLRLATNAQNCQHRLGSQIDNSSGYRNVYWNRNMQMWYVEVQKNYKKYHYGFYTDLEEAAKVSVQARKELFGEFAGGGGLCQVI